MCTHQTLPQNRKKCLAGAQIWTYLIDSVWVKKMYLYQSFIILLAYLNLFVFKTIAQPIQKMIFMLQSVYNIKWSGFFPTHLYVVRGNLTIHFLIFPTFFLFFIKEEELDQEWELCSSTRLRKNILTEC